MSDVASLTIASVSAASDWTFWTVLGFVWLCWTATGTCTAWTGTAAFNLSAAPPAGVPITSSEPLMTPLIRQGCGVTVWLAADTVTTPVPLPGWDTTRVCCWDCVGTVSLITCAPGATLTGVRARTVRGLPRRLMPAWEAPTLGLFVPAEVCSWHWANWWAGIVMILANWTVILSPFSAVAGTMVGIVWITTCTSKKGNNWEGKFNKEWLKRHFLHVNINENFVANRCCRK